ncbi:hypothetical protein BGZ83_003209, partial [Gryganskiella cystojenkinii]
VMSASPILGHLDRYKALVSLPKENVRRRGLVDGVLTSGSEGPGISGGNCNNGLGGVVGGVLGLPVGIVDGVVGGGGGGCG